MRKLCAVLLIGGVSIVAAPGFVFIQANLYNTANHFRASGFSAHAFFDVSYEGEEIVSAQLSNWTGNLTGGGGSSSSPSYFSFEEMRSDVEAGPWTLTVGRNSPPRRSRVHGRCFPGWD